MKPADIAELLPSPQVRFAPDFAARAGVLAARLAGAERREGRGRAAFLGSGEEFVGYRPYRTGEDPRRIDWQAYARLDRAFVRVMRREASERWSVLLDTSASMGVGIPGKLQAAAEVAAAIAVAGMRAGAHVRVATSSGRELELSRRRGLLELLAFLEAERASGSAGLASLLVPTGNRRGLARESGRVFAVGDLFDVGADLPARLARPGRELSFTWILAPEELVPRPDGGVEWVDPETGAALELAVDAAACAAYERQLGRVLERWREVVARHRIGFGAFTSERPFEDVARSVLGPS